MAVVLQFYYVWENKRRDRLAEEGVVGVEGEVKDKEFADVTDRQNLTFRYRL